jgi:hypothetical protein
MHSQLKGLTVLLLALLAATPASAVYRCGNTFQDQPCSSGETGGRIGPSGSPAPAAPKAPAAAGAAAPAGSAAPSRFASVCARVGQDAQAVAWKREAGATQERQLADLPGSASREDMVRTIASVYSRRGSAPEIRAAIEAECVAEKQSQADATAMLKLLTEQAGGKLAQPAASAQSVAAPPNPPSNDAGALVQSVGTTGPSDSAAACASLRTQDDALRAKMRTGGSVTTMETYYEQKRKLDRSRSDAKC